VEGITANPDRMRWFVEHSVGVLTALVPTLGYETASEIAKEALRSGQGVYEIVCGRGLMTREELDRVLNPEAMVRTAELVGARDARAASGQDGAKGNGSTSAS
jgi:aspartate ammonia-lyase